jgi:hypothetical protein
MKINIPKVIVVVPMAGYAPELEGKALQVWVNPPMQMLQAYTALLTTLQTDELEKARQALEMPAQTEERTPLWKAFDQAQHWLNRKKEKAEKSEGVDERLLAWYAELWSQAADTDTHWTVEELRTLESKDPSFLSWLIAETWNARAAHMDQKKKA